MTKQAIIPVTFLYISVLVFISGFRSSEKLNVLVVTGGHKYDTTEFIEMFESFKDMDCDFVWTSEMQSISAATLNDKYDALVLMDMVKEKVPEEYKKQYRELARLGTGMVFMHFTLASRPFWDEYHEIIGGKFFLGGKFTEDVTRRSGYNPSVELEIKVLDRDHEVTAGVNDFKVTDAAYNNLYISENVHPLLGIDHPENDYYAGWTHKYGNSRVVYIMQGYSGTTLKNPSFRKLVNNAIRYVAE
jgi:type 1 glutamine amidotransferase